MSFMPSLLLVTVHPCLHGRFGSFRTLVDEASPQTVEPEKGPAAPRASSLLAQAPPLAALVAARRVTPSPACLTGVADDRLPIILFQSEHEALKSDQALGWHDQRVYPTHT